MDFLDIGIYHIVGIPIAADILRAALQTAQATPGYPEFPEVNNLHIIFEGGTEAINQSAQAAVGGISDNGDPLSRPEGLMVHGC